MSIWKKLFGKAEARHEEHVGQIHITIPDLIRRSLYDANFEGVELSMELLGYQRQSDEVSEMSIRESDERVERVGNLFPVIGLISDAVTQGTMSVLALAVKDSDVSVHGEQVTDEALEAAIARHAADNRALAVAVLSGLVDMGLVSVVGDVKAIHSTTCGHDHSDEDEL
jgi:hypothetical protein